MNRKLFWLLTAILLVSLHRAEAQQPKKIPWIGYISGLSPSSESTRLGALREGLRGLGYAERKNIIIEYRFSGGQNEKLHDLAADLVAAKVDVILAGGAGATSAAQQATKEIPIVMAYMSDPVALGFVVSLAKPGGNITGLSQLAPELGGKRLEILKEVVPNLSRVGVLGTQTTVYEIQFNELKTAAQSLGLQLRGAKIQGTGDLDRAFSFMVKERVGAFTPVIGTVVSFNRVGIVELATKHRLPAIYPLTEFTDVGGLMCYAPNYADLFRRAATYIDKILKGAKPADLPVEQPTKFDFVINLKTAKQIDLTIPPNVLARADRIIK
jgi:putative ABC transport system substrate-binding protein